MGCWVGKVAWATVPPVEVARGATEAAAREEAGTAKEGVSWAVWAEAVEAVVEVVARRFEGTGVRAVPAAESGAEAVGVVVMEEVRAEGVDPAGWEVVAGSREAASSLPKAPVGEVVVGAEPEVDWPPGRMDSEEERRDWAGVGCLEQLWSTS